MNCPNDTDGDGDCHLCARSPGGCFLPRQSATPGRGGWIPHWRQPDDLDDMPEPELECPDCHKPLQDVGGVLGCLCQFGGVWPDADTLAKAADKASNLWDHNGP